MAENWRYSNVQTLPNSSAKATAPSSRNPDKVSGARPWLDGLILLIFPLLLNISLITQDVVSRQVASLIFFALFFKNAVLYSALSIAWQAKVSSTTHYLLGGRSGVFNSLSLLLVLIIIAHLRGFFERVVNFLDFLGFALWAFGILAYTLSVFMLNRGEAQRRFLINAFLAGLALYVLLEKWVPYGNLVSRIAGFGLIVFGLSVAYSTLSFPS